MKKTLIASAVAAAALSTSAFAMDPASELAAKLDSMPTVYGNIQLAGVYADVDNVGSDYTFEDNGSTIGFKHSHEIAPGVTGFFKAEFEFNATQKDSDNNTDGDNGGLDETDETYIGVKGDFGQVWAGQNDTLYEDWIDVTDYYEATGAYVSGNLTPTGEERIIQYTTPSMAGLTAGVAVQVNSRDVNGNHRNGVVAGVKYSLDALTVALVADTADGSLGADTAIGFSATYEMDNLGVAFQYETQDDTVDLYSLLGTYSMGANAFALSYSMNDFDNAALGSADEASTVSAQALHNLSDNMYVYVEGSVVDQDNGANDFSLLALGATYVF